MLVLFLSIYLFLKILILRSTILMWNPILLKEFHKTNGGEKEGEVVGFEPGTLASNFVILIYKKI